MRWLVVGGLWSSVRLALALIVLWQGARLVFRSDPRDDLRRIDAQFTSGRYYDALQEAAALTAREPNFAPGWARVGMLHAIRDEQPAASQSLGYAIGLGLAGRDYELARLYQGRVATAAGQRDEAAQFWALVAEPSPLFPIRRVLEAESLLAAQDYAGAEAAYRAALLPALPPDWRALVYTRLAALRASSDPAGALAELARIGAPVPAGPLPSSDGFIAPLLASSAPDPRRLAAALRAAPPDRAQLLGQVYLDAGWYALAEAQFAAVAPGSPGAAIAATYAAYARWRAGERAEGLRQLEALVAAHPDDPRARALLALAYLAGKDDAGARAQLGVVRAMAPRAPDTHLAWAQWYAARHDYIRAADEYRRAFNDAPPGDRGRFALALARFHLDTALRVCEVGYLAAEEAARLLPDDAGAWIALASARLTCGDPAGARTAAERALARSPDDAEANYYLGRALAALGDRSGARRALIQAADLAPASPWRARAETQLAALGPS
ncbi:MAG TPA: tetratricopeptide repeat protein [Roseiflexaceae bacterium]